MLSFYRALAALRRAEPALHAGDYTGLDVGAAEVLAYRRSLPGERGFTVVLNLGAATHTLDLARPDHAPTAVALSTHMDRTGPIDPARVTLRPNEGLLLRDE
jgi:alpha-glucosidase